MAHTNDLKTRVLNTLGGLGYISCFFQWLWTIAIFTPSLVDSSFFKTFIASDKPAENVTNQVATASGPVSPIIIWLGVFVGVAILALCIYVILAKIPRSISKAGENITHQPAKVITPFVGKHVKIKPKVEREISNTIIVTMKLLLVFTPLCLLTMASTIASPVPFEFIMILALVMASWSLLFFALQMLLARYFKIGYDSIR